MARKNKKNEKLYDVLLASPWQVSVIFSIIGFIALRWVIPSQFSQSSHLVSLAMASKSVAPFMGVFLIPGLLSFLRQHKKTISTEPTLNRPRSSMAYVNTVSPQINKASLPKTIQLETNDRNRVHAEWSLTLLKEIEWKRFELLCAEYFRCLGKRVDTINHGADGGIDARVYSDKTNALEYAIQCKSWNSAVGVKELRELFGVMSHESAGKGIFMTTSDFTEEAKLFAAEHNNKLFLIDGAKFVSMLLKLPDSTKAKLLNFATEGDYKTPSCPSCGTKLVERVGKNKSFWGCINFPKCRTTMYI